MSTSDESKQLQDLLDRLQETLPRVSVYPSDQVTPGTHRCIHYRMPESSKDPLRLHVRAATDEAMDAIIKGIYRTLELTHPDAEANEYRDPDNFQEKLDGYHEWTMEIHFDPSAGGP